ncbi:MAG: type IA DNA topoisomerase [Eubacterium sp.]|nr:type IA DNA topoisomerase [Eubacterium sp.]
MSKSLYIAEKPSVAREFAKALGENTKNHDGYMESEHSVITWCVGHLVSMSYPEAYDPKYKKWSLETLPFLPDDFLYEVIPGVKKQFEIVSGLLRRPDVDVIYICTDSGREGEYIYRLVDQMANVGEKTRRRVWIDSQTEEEILRGIREAKDWSEYDNLSASAYLRAKEDYLMGINFSRLLTLKYGNSLASFLKQRYAVISVGRVMTCVLGMVVRREREIRNFVKTPFFRVFADAKKDDTFLSCEWKAVEGSRYFASPKLYKENGFREKKDAQELIDTLSGVTPQVLTVHSINRKQEKKNPPLLYNLAELQNDCSRLFKISPDETLKVVQELYERKLVTYPRTDARVLSSAVAKEIDKNLRGLQQLRGVAAYVSAILENGAHKKIAKSKYVNDKAITDHYAIIPTGQGIAALSNLKPVSQHVYEAIVRRFLAVFLPPAVYQKVSLDAVIDKEHFFLNTKVLKEKGYLSVMNYSFSRKASSGKPGDAQNGASQDGQTDGGNTQADPERLAEVLGDVKKGSELPIAGFSIKEGETSPPKRYNSGSIVLAMENAGQLIEDEELREQIKGSGIGTSATRAEILKKLVGNKYLSLNKKTQVITPTLMGELIYDIVDMSIRPLLNAELTASWEKGLTYVAEGTITSDEYMVKLDDFIRRRTSHVLNLKNQYMLRESFRNTAPFYNK